MKKILENPSAKKLLDQIQCMEIIGDIFGSGTHVDQFNEIKKQFAVLLVPDKFNETFSQQGWIAYESMSLDAMLKAIEIEKKEGFASAEDFLANEYGEGTLTFGIQRCSGHAEFRKRSPDSLPEGTPERAVAEFLANWCGRRYGPMSETLLDYLNTPKGTRAGNTMKDFGCRVLIAYRVLKISEQTPAISRIEVDLVLQKEQATETVRTSVQVIFSDSANDAVRWGHGSGAWKIFQNGFANVIYQQ